MEPTLYILCKSEKEDLTGRQYGGDYVARANTGVDKDGSPKYRYFRTAEAYKTFIEGKTKSKKKTDPKKKSAKETLESKLDKEHKASKKSDKEDEKPSLFVKKDK